MCFTASTFPEASSLQSTSPPILPTMGKEKDSVLDSDNEEIVISSNDEENDSTYSVQVNEGHQWQ